jgi:hypothetical protein
MVLLAGCARMARVDRDVALEDALRRYAAALRWGHADAAKGFLRARDGQPLAGPEAFRDDLRVAEYRVTAREPGPDGNTVTVRAALEYYLVSRNVLRRAEDVQHWWYDADARRWYLEGDLPAALVAGGQHD